MHEHGGFFCKTVNPGIISKIADLGKNVRGPNLASPIVHRRGWGLLTLGQGPAEEEEAQAAQIWASGVLAAQEAGHAGAVEDGVNARARRSSPRS